MNGGTSSKGWRDGSVNKRPGSTGTGSGFIPQIYLKSRGWRNACMIPGREKREAEAVGSPELIGQVA